MTGKNAVLFVRMLPTAAKNGGAAVLDQHCRALVGLGWNVTLVAPDEPRNVNAGPLPKGVSAILYKATPLLKIFQSVYNGAARFLPLGILEPWRYLAVRRNAAVTSAVMRADYLEIQWQDNLPLAQHLGRLNRRAPLGVYLHDVLSQKARREYENSRGFAERGVRRLRYLLTGWVQTGLLRRCDLKYVLSEKDRAELCRFGSEIGAHVLRPPVNLGVARSVSHRDVVGDSNPPRVLFVAALNRTENEDAVEWFVDHVWPRILRDAPSVRFVIAGSGQSRRVEKVVQRASGIDFVGYVDDLQELYDGVTAAVIPLRAGAGVKIKTLEALVCGLPTVSTTVGMEGIDVPEAWDYVSDDAVEFACMVTSVVRNAAESRARTCGIAAQVRRDYSFDTYTASLSSVLS